ncbi:MAG: Wzz/FepE/Etk N-terminal domain-containing protein [Pseudomonadales bacterium]|nr:Wzz/FepE/Etk N-terminal domain-containing protein [Pseudomonadales bacterium]
MTNTTDNPSPQQPPQTQAIIINPEQLYGTNTDDEIDLRELWNTIWAGKWIILATTAVFAIAAVIYALSLPNIYKSTATLIPTSGEEQSGAASLAASFGGLASMAGVSLGGSGIDKTQIAIETLKSREFLSKFITEHNLKPDILAAKSWDITNNRIVYDNELYNLETKTWNWESKSQWKKESQPSAQEAISELLKIISFNYDDKSSMVNISASHLSPFVAQQWVQWVIKDINQHMRKQDIAEANISIGYLTKKLEETSLAEMQKIFYELIEAQTKTKMLAEIRDQYVLKVIDAPVIPEVKDRPNRLLVGFVGMFLGWVSGILGCFLRVLANKNR